MDSKISEIDKSLCTFFLVVLTTICIVLRGPFLNIQIFKTFNPIPIGLFLSNIDGGGGVFHPTLRVEIGECDTCH